MYDCTAPPTTSRPRLIAACARPSSRDFRASTPNCTSSRSALDDVRRQVLVREPGVGGECPHCGELFGSDAHYCSNCGLPLTESARRELARGPRAAPARAPVRPAPERRAPAAVEQPTQEIPPLDPDHPRSERRIPVARAATTRPDLGRREEPAPAGRESPRGGRRAARRRPGRATAEPPPAPRSDRRPMRARRGSNNSRTRPTRPPKRRPDRVRPCTAEPAAESETARSETRRAETTDPNATPRAARSVAPRRSRRREEPRPPHAPSTWASPPPRAPRRAEKPSSETQPARRAPADETRRDDGAPDAAERQRAAAPRGMPRAGEDAAAARPGLGREFAPGRALPANVRPLDLPPRGAAPVSTMQSPPPDAPIPPGPPERHCPRCGSTLGPEQEWCLPCGAAADTEIVEARGWRVPLYLGGALAALAILGVVLAILALSSNKDQVAPPNPKTAGVPVRRSAAPCASVPTIPQPPPRPRIPPLAHDDTGLTERHPRRPTPTRSRRRAPPAHARADADGGPRNHPRPATTRRSPAGPAGGSGYTIIIESQPLSIRSREGRRGTRRPGLGRQSGFSIPNDHSLPAQRWLLGRFHRENTRPSRKAEERRSPHVEAPRTRDAYVRQQHHTGVSPGHHGCSRSSARRASGCVDRQHPPIGVEPVDQDGHHRRHLERLRALAVPAGPPERRPNGRADPESAARRSDAAIPAKPASLTRQVASGSSRWASKPAPISTSSGSHDRISPHATCSIKRPVRRVARCRPAPAG